ncbi:hypothetical protein OG730_40720 [Streptomyces sp. NBC_01298]|uniref:hypothetical protein n=1 Tax=Streptomyces sp. NBC_01298 TaxID=2903817 RepID=UPI002E1036B4|nr:hypothetical protein OG730_40720 [Streptomyces sp. NBC_01298]
MRRTHNRALLTMSALALASTLTSAPQAQALDNGVGRPTGGASRRVTQAPHHRLAV